MSRTPELKPHLSVDELGAMYRSAATILERARAQVIWLLAKGESPRHVADVVGYTIDWVGTLRRRYNREGPSALLDGRRNNPGAEPLLSPAQMLELDDAVRNGPAPDGGPWNGPQVARWMSERTGKPVHPQRGWEYLRRLGYSPQRPRPRHKGADAEAQARFQAGVAG